MLNLKLYRLHKNLSVDDVADKAGVSAEYYLQIEEGLVKPSITVAQKISAVLGCKWTSLI